MGRCRIEALGLARQHGCLLGLWFLVFELLDERQLYECSCLPLLVVSGLFWLVMMRWIL